MSAHVLLNLLNTLGKRDKITLLHTSLINSTTTGARMLDSIIT